MLRKRDKREAVALAFADEALRLRLLEEDKETRGVLQIVGYEVTQCWGFCDRGVDAFLPLLVNTMRGSAWGGFRVPGGS